MEVRGLEWCFYLFVCQSLVRSFGSVCVCVVCGCGCVCVGVKGHFQASAAFLLERFVFPSTPPAFLELLAGRLPASGAGGVACSAAMTAPGSGAPGPSGCSSCSRQHSCPVGGQERSAPSW